MTITQDQLKQIFQYDNGKLYWKIDRTNKTKAGQIAGTLDNDGYMRTTVNRRKYFNHVLIFIYHHGYLPDKIDHADNNRLNNSIDNLRPATGSQNQQNRKLGSNNTSGIKGVFKNHGKWRVALRIDGKRRYFGSYYDIEVARFIADTMRHKYHGQFARNC